MHFDSNVHVISRRANLVVLRLINAMWIRSQTLILYRSLALERSIMAEDS